jgi:hypothetical protein
MMLRDVWGFLGAVWGTWVSRMTGIVGLGLWLVGAILEPMPVSLRWSFLICGTIALFIACFVAWRTKHQEALQLARRSQDDLQAQREVFAARERQSINTIQQGLLIGRQMATAGPGLAILQASFGTGECWSDVTEQVRKRVGNGRLSIASPERGDELGTLGFPDPAPNQRKRLLIVYAVDGEPAFATAWPGERIDLPLPSNQSTSAP